MVSDKRSGPIHPLLYRHPETGRPVLCFHLGMTERFVMDYGQPQARHVDEKETLAILDQIQAGLLRSRCIFMQIRMQPS
jgi:taurine dioxygenase